MVKLVWFIDRPEKDIEGFESWYQDEHVAIGMRQEHLTRFRISRSFYPQPPFVARLTGSDQPRAYRFSEGYWRSMDDIRRCYVSVHGRAALADGFINRTAPSTPRPPSPVLAMEEEIFPVARRLGFDLWTGRYGGELPCKLFGFVRLEEQAGAEFDRRYGALAKGASEDPDLRGHVRAATLDEVVRPGRAMRWPPEGAEHFDRSVEYYFDDRSGLDRFCGSEWMGEALALLGEFAVAQTWDAARIQEVFYTADGDQPLEDSWKAFYPS